MLERAGELGGLDVAHRCLAFHPRPHLERAAGGLARQRHVEGGVEKLAPIVDAGAELLRGVEALDQRLVDGRAVGAVAPEQRQALHPARPLLVHLRRRLDEVALDAGPGVREVVRRRQDAVQHVPELVQERLELVVREARAIEVRHEDADGVASAAAADPAHGPRGRVFVLAVARIEIEVDAGGVRAGRRIEHVEIDHILVPHRHLRALEADTVEALADVEHPAHRRLRGEELPQLFLVDGIAPLAQPLAVERHVPAVDARLLDAGADDRRLQLRELRQVAQLGLGDDAANVLEEACDRIGILGHAPLRDVVCVARHLVEICDLLAQRDDLVEDVEVPGGAPECVLRPVAAPRILVERVHEEGDVVGIVEADHDVALLVPRHPVQPRLRQTAAFLGREGEARRVLADVLRELLPELGQPVGDLLVAPAFFRRQRDAAVLERLEQVLAELPRGDRRRHDPLHAVVEGLVLEDVREEARLLHERDVGGIADVHRGMDAVEERDRAERVLEDRGRLVPHVEDVLDRDRVERDGFDAGQQIAGSLERTLARTRHVGGVQDRDRCAFCGLGPRKGLDGHTRGRHSMAKEGDSKLRTWGIA